MENVKNDSNKGFWREGQKKTVITKGGTLKKGSTRSR